VADDERTGRADVRNVELTQFLGENAWAEGPVSANVDTAQEDDGGHKVPLSSRAA
jgi:hypothetical protein